MAELDKALSDLISMRWRYYTRPAPLIPSSEMVRYDQLLRKVRDLITKELME